MEHPITSTLFRFVKLRSPQLQEEPARATKYQTSLNQGYFFTALENEPSGTIKALAMRQAAESFPSPYESVEEVKSISESLYNFSEWLARNKKSYNDTDLVNEYDKVSKGLTSQELETMWDNLYYQAVTQKSFYVKEAISQMLLADHAYRLVDTDIEHAADYNREVVNAKLVLPSELFSDYIKVATDSETSTKYQPNIPTGFLKSQIIVSSAKMRIENYGGLIKELSRSENKYRESYSVAYSQAYKQYEEDIAPTLETYRQDLESARQAYCSVQNPDIPYDPKNPCHQPAYVPYPSLPEFSFSYEDEITAAKMEEELSEKSLNVLFDVLGYDLENDTPEGRSDLLKSYPTYKSIYPEVESARRKASTELIENIAPFNTTVNFAGYDYSVNKSPRMRPDSFNLCAARVNQRYNAFTLNIGVPDNTWQIFRIVITITKPDDSTYSVNVNAPSATYSNGVLSLQSFYTYSIPQIGGDDNDILDFKITYTNGSIRNIENIDAEMTFCTLGTALGTDPAYNQVNTNPPFAPKYFGIRDLGVADYLKVEQTVQCYVEGEVSHIENIMAREYKERATRMLRRTEETTTVSSEMEQERLTDTTTTNRHELQSEISRVISESKDLGASVTANYDGGGSFSVSTGLSYATNTSQENSSRLAETTAQEITERATERIVSKIKEERISKIIEEYEENNKHGFDNRFGNQHVVGVYRWVDKLYKNQIWNYGKRMMLEFMIPDPAELHVLGMTEEVIQNNNEIEKPINPRKPNDPALDPYAISNYTSLTDDKIAYWAGYYNVEIEPKPENRISIGESFHIKWDGVTKLADVETNSGNGKITIPEGYKAKRATGIFNAVSDNTANQGRLLSLTVGNKTATYHQKFASKSMPLDSNVMVYSNNNDFFSPEVSNFFELGPDYTNEIPVSYTLGNHASGDISVTITCEATSELINGWKLRTFKAIIDAYQEALDIYNEKRSAEQPTEEKKETNPGFYRQIENLVLRKNCISYLTRQIGGSFSYGANMATGDSFENFEVNLSQGLDNYTNTVKFLEQAFEWDIISYNFYPYFWGKRDNWSAKYQFNESDDPLFRSFMQAGMARVVVTVRPGFEEAAALYLSTGFIWNGGTVPTIGDPLYLDLVAEVTREEPPKKEGKAWITRLPTTLTILQADSIGLKVEKALPCNCGEEDEFEEGTVIPCNSNFEITNAQLGNEGQTAKIQFVFHDLDHLNVANGNVYDVATYDDNGYFPRRYECMGQHIAIDRDASWQPEDSVSIVYEQLAQQLSAINGVEAQQVFVDDSDGFNNPDGIKFTIDTAIIPDFIFTKKNSDGGFDVPYDVLRVITSNGNVRIIYGDYNVTGRLQDKSGIPIQDFELNTLLPIDKFKI